MGICAGHVVVGLARIQGGANEGFECREPGLTRGRHAETHVRTHVAERVERRQRVADHRVHIERARRLIEGPERFRTIGVESGQGGQRDMGKIARRNSRLIEGAQERERLKPCVFEARAQVRRDAAAAHSGRLREAQLGGLRPLAVE